MLKPFPQKQNREQAADGGADRDEERREDRQLGSDGTVHIDEGRQECGEEEKDLGVCYRHDESVAEEFARRILAIGRRLARPAQAAHPQNDEVDGAAQLNPRKPVTHRLGDPG